MNIVTEDYVYLVPVRVAEIGAVVSGAINSTFSRWSVINASGL